MKNNFLQIGLGLALGAGMGVAVAFMLGTGGVWLALGIAIGTLIGISIAGASGKEHEQSEAQKLWVEKQQ